MIQMLCRWNPARINRCSFASLLATLLLCSAIPSLADRQPGSLSTVKRSLSTGNVEVIHRLHNHDAELGIMAALNDRSLSLEQMLGRAQLALYIEERFILANVVDGEIGAPLDLQLIGAELDGEYVLVYQEFIGSLPTELAVRNDILRDVFPEQINHVNIALEGDVRSLTFKDKDRWLTTTLVQ